MGVRELDGGITRQSDTSADSLANLRLPCARSLMAEAKRPTETFIEQPRHGPIDNGVPGSPGSEGLAHLKRLRFAQSYIRSDLEIEEDRRVCGDTREVGDHTPA